MNILAACGGPDSPVRKFVFKSSAHYYGCERDDPAYFTEAMRRPHPPRTPIEQDIVEAERAVAAFGERNRGVDRHGAALRQRARPGPRARATPRCSRCRPCRRSSASTRATSSSPRTTSAACSSTRRVTTCRAPTTPPATACWCCPRSPRCSASRSRRCCRRGGPASPPAALRRAGLRIPSEMLQQLRYGRALDNRRLKAAGYAFRATSRETVQAFAAAPAHPRRCGPGRASGYQYEREVEEFLRWSPAVRGDDRLGLGRLGARSARGGGARARSRVDARPARLAPRGTPRTRPARCAPARPPPPAGRPTPSWPPSRSG